MSTKISELPSATSLTSSDEVPIVQTGTTKKTTIGQIQQNANYSTTEQVVGTWIDGKPLYQRTLTASTTSSSTSTKLDLSTIPNLKDIHSIKGIVKKTDGGFTWCVPYFKSLNDFANFYYSIGQYGGFYFQSGDQAGFGNFEVTIQYTKTTD